MMSIKKNATMNVIKQVSSIVFPLISFPYVARILGTNSYGMYTFASSFISYFILIAGLGINNYAIREGARIREKKNIINDFINDVFSINVCSTIVSYILLFVLLIFWEKLDGYTSVILILSLQIVFTTIGTDWINIIYEDYAYITKRYIFSHMIAMVLLFIIVRDEKDISNYAFSSVFGVILANIVNIYYIHRKFHIYPKFTLSKRSLNHLAPILILFANTVASTIYINSDITILGAIKNDYSVGIYGVASKVYSLVKGVTVAAIMVVIPRVSYLIQKGDKKEINRIYTQTLSGIILIIVPTLVGMICLSKEIVVLIAGKSYLAGFQPLIILSLALLFATLACFYINGVLIPYRKESIVLGLTILSALVNIVLNIVLIPRYDFNAAAITTVLSEIIMCLGGMIASARYCKVSIFRESIISVVSGIFVIAISYFTHHLLQNLIMIILCTVTASIVSYIIVIWIVKDNAIYSIIKQILKK